MTEPLLIKHRKYSQTQIEGTIYVPSIVEKKHIEKLLSDKDINKLHIKIIGEIVFPENFIG